MKKIEIWLIQHIGYVPTFILRNVVGLLVLFIIPYSVGFAYRPEPYTTAQGNYLDGAMLIVGRFLYGGLFLFMGVVVLGIFGFIIYALWEQYTETYPPQKDKK